MSHLFHCHEENSPWPQEAHGDLPEGLCVFLNGCNKTLKLLCSQKVLSFILCISTLILTLSYLKLVYILAICDKHILSK